MYDVIESDIISYSRMFLKWRCIERWMYPYYSSIATIMGNVCEIRDDSQWFEWLSVTILLINVFCRYFERFPQTNGKLLLHSSRTCSSESSASIEYYKSDVAQRRLFLRLLHVMRSAFFGGVFEKNIKSKERRNKCILRVEKVCCKRRA